MLRAIFITLLAIFASVTDTAGQEQEQPWSEIDALFSHLDDEGGPGLAVGVVDEGELVFAEGYGLASLEHGVPITSQTVFDVASVSKQFTGLSVAMLVEEGKLSLDDDVRTYLPELHDFGETMTIGHLVHHTSGLRDWVWGLGAAGWALNDVISFEHVLDFAFHQRSLNYAPGAEYSYSNTGYNLLAEIIARVEGTSFRSWTDQNLFRPLGMTRTHVHDDPTEVVPDRAIAYEPREDGGWSRMTDNLTTVGSSSLFTTVEDLAKWIVNFETAEVAGRSAIELATTTGTLNDGSTNSYAFGLYRSQHRGATMLEHGGFWQGFNTDLLYLPEHRFGVVVLANHTTGDAHQAALDVVDIYWGEELNPVEEAPQVDDVNAVDVPPAVLDRYVGRYRIGPGRYVEIRRDGSALILQPPGGSSVSLISVSRTEFLDEEAGMISAFEETSGPSSWLEVAGRRYPRAMPPPPLSPSEMIGYAGEYFSEELRTSYWVSIRGESLVLSQPHHGGITLEHSGEDSFDSTWWFARSIRFTRDGRGEVDGFLMNASPRTRNLRFLKRR